MKNTVAFSSQLFTPLLLCAFFMTSCASSYQSHTSRSPKPIGNPGSCYAKAKLPLEVSFDVMKYARYTGNDPKIEHQLISKVMTIEKARKKWQKKKADNNCLSPNPEDCLVWCIVDVPAVIQRIEVLPDTSITKEFTIETLEYNKVIADTDKTDWYEVVCENDMTPNLLNQCRKALKDKNYDVSLEEAGLTEDFKKAFRAYQEQNLLARGPFTLETVNHLLKSN